MRVEWPAEADGETARMMDFFGAEDGKSEIGTWLGSQDEESTSSDTIASRTLGTERLRG